MSYIFPAEAALPVPPHGLTAVTDPRAPDELRLCAFWRLDPRSGRLVLAWHLDACGTPWADVILTRLCGVAAAHGAT